MEAKLYAARKSNGYLYLFEGKVKKSGRTFYSDVMHDGRQACKEFLPVVRYDNSPVELGIDPNGNESESIWAVRNNVGELYLSLEKPAIIDSIISFSSPYMKWTGSDMFTELENNSCVKLSVIKNEKKIKNSFRDTGEQIEAMMSKLRKESIKFIKDTIIKESGKKGSINIYDEDENDPVYVSYDGGSHPEYASNLYSMVYDVHINSNGKLVLCIEDSDDYEITRCTTMEIYEVACMIDDLFGED